MKNKEELARIMLICNHKTNEHMTEIAEKKFDADIIHQIVFDLVSNMTISIELMQKHNLIDDYYADVDQVFETGDEIKKYIIDGIRKDIEKQRKSG
jgi:hypothetical protein